MRWLPKSLILFGGLLLMMTGCVHEDAIQHLTVSHEARESIRLRVAIFPRKEWVWFIRLSGPENQVNEQSAAFEKFVRSVRFDDKKTLITWDEPKDWKKDPSSGERYAGFRIDAKPQQLEVTVTRLPADKYRLIQNIHRWQKQINLPLAENEGEDLKPYLTDERIGEQPLTWVDMKGLGVHTVSKAPDPMAGKGKLGGLPLNKHKLKVPFQYKVPDGWIEKQPPDDGITSALLEVSQGDDTAKVTLTALPRKGGGLLFNIHRWRGQLKLPPLPEAELEEMAKTAAKIQVSGIQSDYVDLNNPDGPPTNNRILGVLVPVNKLTWVIRMSGPSAWVGLNKTAFEKFVREFQLDAQ